MSTINVKIISDVVCPFCYLGKKRLEKAIDVYKKTVPGGADDRFDVSWQPFYLDPNAPKTSVPTKQRLAQKFGADRAEDLNARMRAMGAAEGINFTHEGKVGNTRDAHRIIQLAKTQGADKEDSVVSSLFRSYFEEGGDITSHDDLAAAAERGGLDAATVRDWLSSDKGGTEVDAEVSEAFQHGVHGVPHFIINDSVEVGGAQDVQTFVGEFLRAKKNA
ncbi:hypothetical protein HMPREF1624_00984 [Sporothrix schenckii ATCC 58251]|uniref:DSBA-like thioredoxin domain-containing protein n=1 Tax=Sporothrix schenckii (strain ATCC 58251 / de Perez 2211183) TaxID=1391915 RepID=U7Q4A2_SPOS1|nr:hypothetical protein HMPREF1624_00984 [Sporothrix schenckii ATCC 58251]